MRLNFFIGFRHLPGCYEVIRPCIEICEGVFRIACTDFSCTEKVKTDNKYECDRLCYLVFANADFQFTRTTTVRKRRPWEPLRQGNVTTDEYYYNYVEESTTPYSLTNSSTSLDDTYYEYLKSQSLAYQKPDLGYDKDLETKWMTRWKQNV